MRTDCIKQHFSPTNSFTLSANGNNQRSNREVRVLLRARSARFVKIVVDEAQDCNQSDIETLDWLRDEGIRLKMICDPHQSIFEFRGGVTDQLFALRSRFRVKDQLRIGADTLAAVSHVA
jgi:superfamily I DNA/RNA helicase